MEIDKDKIDEAVLALMYLTLDQYGRAWKGFDFAATDRLYEKGYIDNPINKNKSVALTANGIEESERLFNKLFTKKP